MTHTLTEKQFIRDFISSYKENSILWDTNNPDYKNRTLRDEAYNVLVQKCAKYSPVADVDFVKTKIRNIRTCFKREFRRAQSSVDTENPYVSNLWYYDLLLFLEGEEDIHQFENDVTESACVKEDFENLNQAHSLIDQHAFLSDFIDCYKENECLWNISHVNYHKKTERNKAYSNLLQKCRKYYPDADSSFIKAKIGSFRTCFRREYQKTLYDIDYKPTLWYYDSLLFLVGQEYDSTDRRMQSSEDEIKKEDFVEEDDIIDAFTEQKQFIVEFITLYKEQKILWDKTDPNYKNMKLRNNAYRVLKDKYAEYFPHADEDFVRTKIDSIRTCFRKEYRKVQASLNTGNIYRPSLWYYDLLLFIVDQNEQENTNESSTQLDENVNNNHSTTKVLSKYTPTCWTREHTVILIDLFKKYPCLFNDKQGDRLLKLKSLKKVHLQLINKTGKYFKLNDVRKKILVLRRQYVCEHRKAQESRRTKGKDHYKPKLWSYKLLSFLNTNENIRKVGKTIVKPKNVEINDEVPDTTFNNIEVINTDLDFKQSYTNENDIYDTISKNVAHKLRDMSERQRNIAERILHDLMYYGQMEELTDESYLCLRNSFANNR